MKAKVDPKEPWVLRLDTPAVSGSIKTIRMVGTERNPGRGNKRYLHIEGKEGEILHVCGEKTLAAIREMLKP